MAVTSADIDKVVEGRTVPTEFLKMVSANPDAVALRWRNDDGSWGEWTFADYAERVGKIVKGYQDLGINQGDRVVLMMRNIPEFSIADMGACFLGATPVSIYNSSSPEQIEYLVNHCEARVAIVEDMGYLERFLKVRSLIPTIEKIIILKDPENLAPDDVSHWDTLFGHGSVDLAEQAQVAKPEDLATLIYTSGTTGPPKAVMISHYNVTWTAESLIRSILENPAFDADDLVGKRLVSYLPMAHIAERMTSHYQQAINGYEVSCCPDPSQIGLYLREVKPNVVFGVPRVWEKIHAGVTAALAADPEKKAQFDAGVAAAMELDPKIDWGTATDEEKGTWDFLQAVFADVRALIGLDACELAISGAAPIPAELLKWFRAIGVPLTEVYGMSENTGPMTYRSVKIKPGTVGIAVPGAEVTLAEDGEIICRGGLVFQGYMNDPEKTADALDDDGWLHSGDIGQIDEDGYVRIVDRKKELIITAGGKNISPANLEAALKMIPLVGQACAIGDQRPFVSALVVLDPEVAPAWARAQGIEFGTLAELAEDPRVIAEIEAHLPEVMESFNNAERVKKVKVLGEEWLPDSEMLTPTSKLKRRGVHGRYAEEIEALYS